ncbi:MAG: hypothetical protein ACRDYV_01800, partial [Acidimicrobiia bacterium]
MSHRRSFAVLLALVVVAGPGPAARAADQAHKEVGGKAVPLAFVSGDEAETIEFFGYAYKREASTLS